MHPANCSMALDFLMKEAPNQDHYDSGYEGICPGMSHLSLSPTLLEISVLRFRGMPVLP